jgi:hypothetical protein
MIMKRVPTVLTLLSILLCAVFVQKASADDLYVVATKSMQEASSNWFGFLKIKDVPFKAITPEEFKDFKLEKYIIIMGGMDEPGGMRELLKDILTDEEFSWASQVGNGKMYLKSNRWAMGQNIMVFAGSNKKAAEEARKANKDEWFETLGDWFDIETGEEGLRAY